MTPKAGGPERLQKILAAAGVASRRKAEELIAEGRVVVNGRVATELGTKADPARDRIEVDGRVISTSGPKVYMLLNKPRGVISALSDPGGRPVVTDLLKRLRTRVFPVGRLDFDAEGVILLTNDGDLSNRLIHPTFRVAKTYQVKVRGVPDAKDLARLAGGVRLEDGRTLPARAHLVRETKENSWLELTVYEGRNHLVKRMCAAVGHPVSKLKRTGFAGLTPGRLKPGEWRRLTAREVERLKGVGVGDSDGRKGNRKDA
ncbi:MAG: pseudouridine synthase [Thermodesulfobacteriota bacterium]